MTARKTAKKPTRRKRAESNGHTNAGTITIDVMGGEYDGQTIRMDVTVVKMVAERVSANHDLQTDEDGMIVATPEFALELDQQLQKMGYNSTPTIALHAWIKASEYFAALQKKTS